MPEDTSTAESGDATLQEAVQNLVDVVEGDAEVDDMQRYREIGLDAAQKQIADKYAGEGRIQVDDAHIPTGLEKLAAKAKIPWSFELDGVGFVVKTSTGAGRNPSEWWWREDGYRFTFYKYDSGDHEVKIDAV